MKKKWWIVAVAVVLVAALGYVGFGVWQRMSAQGAAAQAVAEETALVRRGTLVISIDATGSLAPSAEVSLAFTSGGQVAEVFVEEGQVVAAGQPLVRLETDELALQVVQAQTTLRQAELQLEDLQEPADEADVEIARAAVSDAAAAYEEARMNLTLTEHSVSVGDDVRDARYARDETYRTYQKLVSKLGEDDSRTEKAHDNYLDALGQYNRAVENADLQMTAAQNDGTQAYHALQQAQDDLDELLAGADERDVESAQLEIDQASAALEQARLSVAQATLTAPMAGTVTGLHVQPGEMASAGQAVVVLSDVAALEVAISLDETDVARVTIGQGALVSVDAFPDAELTGEVTYIAPVAEIESGVVLYPITVGLMPADLPVRAGMTADVEIITASQEDALIVPLRAVHTEDGRAYVYQMVGDRVERVEVELGMMTETEIEITSGLAEGDVVSVVAAPTQDSTEGFGPMRMFGGGGED